jgi:hypothetical protein
LGLGGRSLYPGRFAFWHEKRCLHDVETQLQSVCLLALLHEGGSGHQLWRRWGAYPINKETHRRMHHGDSTIQTGSIKTTKVRWNTRSVLTRTLIASCQVGGEYWRSLLTHLYCQNKSKKEKIIHFYTHIPLLLTKFHLYQ